MSSPKYLPLPEDPPTIRVLVLEPSPDQTSPIEASLIHVNLSRLENFGACRYEALSYAWGDLSLPRITGRLNGHEHGILPNLDDALRQLRRKVDKRYLWADALCINQDDLKERGHQVQIMRRVYGQAQRVLVWLGRPTDESVNSLRSLQYFASPEHSQELETFIEHERSRSSRTPALWDGLPELLRSTWFKRVWVWQEVITAAKIKVFYGNEVIDWANMVEVIKRMLDTGLPSVPTVNLLTTREGSASSKRDSRLGLVAVSMMHATRQRFQELGGISFSDMISIVTRLELDATDPRDLVYAILGFSDVGGRLRVDYTISVVDLFSKVMALILLNGNGWSLLANYSNGGCFRSDLPSWVVDFSEASRSSFLMSGFATYEYSAGTDRRARFTISKPLLRVQGLVVDVIRSVGKCFKWTDTFSEREKWFSDSLATVSPVLAESHAESSDSTVIHHFGSILSGGYNASYAPDIASSWDALIENETMLSLPKALSGTDAFGEHIALRVVASLCHERALFTTKLGHIGLGSPECAPGDKVCILFGASVPFILREVSENRHILMCGAYVDGVMKGEALKAMDEGKYEACEFVIE